MSSQFRNDRIFCNCDRYEFPHRYDPPKCPPGFNSIEILKEQGKDPKPALKPEIKTGWICSHVFPDGHICGAVNPLTTQKCLSCGR